MCAVSFPQPRITFCRPARAPVRAVFFEQPVEQASRGCSQVLDHVRVDHRGFHVRVSEVLLDLADVDAVEQQVRCDGVPERMGRDRLVDPRRARRAANRFLDDGLADVVAAHDACARVRRQGAAAFARAKILCAKALVALGLAQDDTRGRPPGGDVVRLSGAAVPANPDS